MSNLLSIILQYIRCGQVTLRNFEREINAANSDEFKLFMGEAREYASEINTAFEVVGFALHIEPLPEVIPEPAPEVVINPGPADVETIVQEIGATVADAQNGQVS